MNLRDVIRFLLILGILSTQSLSESINTEEKREFSGATSLPYLPYRTGSRLLSALFPEFDYASYWYTPGYTSIRPYRPFPDYSPIFEYTSRSNYNTGEYTSRRPYWSTKDYTSRFIYTSGRPYWYTSGKPYWFTTGRFYWNTTGSPYWYSTGRPYWYSTGRPYWYSTGRPYWYTTGRPYWFTTLSPQSTRFVTGITAESDTTRTPDTTAFTTATAQPSTVQPTTDVTPTKHEYKGINNFYAEKIIFIGNNVFVSK